MSEAHTIPVSSVDSAESGDLLDKLVQSHLERTVDAALAGDPRKTATAGPKIAVSDSPDKSSKEKLQREIDALMRASPETRQREGSHNGAPVAKADHDDDAETQLAAAENLAADELAQRLNAESAAEDQADPQIATPAAPVEEEKTPATEAAPAAENPIDASSSAAAKSPPPAPTPAHAAHDLLLMIAQIFDLPFANIPSEIKQIIGFAAMALLAGGIALFIVAAMYR